MILDPRENTPCTAGGLLHRHVRGQPRCADCNALIIVGERFIRSAKLEPISSAGGE